MNASNLVLVKTLRHQAEEIAQQRINGWGNTMSDAADAIEAQDMDNVFLDKQLAALRSELEQVKGERDAMRGAIGNLFVIIGNYTGDEIKCDRITEKMWIADAYALKAGKG